MTKDVEYQAVLRDTGNNGWSSGSYFHIKYKNQYLIQEGRLVYSNVGTLDFKLTDIEISEYYSWLFQIILYVGAVIIAIIAGIIAFIISACKNKKKEMKTVSLAFILCSLFSNNQWIRTNTQ